MEIIRSKKSILFILITLTAGVLIYVFLRPPLYWSSTLIVLNHEIVDITWLPPYISMFILYHFADILWALAFAETVYVINGNHMLGIIVAFISTVLFETMQYFDILPGTGDIWDVFFVAISLFIYLVIRKGVRNEKEV